MFQQAQTYFVGNRRGKKVPDSFMRKEKQQVDDLLDKILMPENIRAAIDEVRKNKGAPGIDKMPVEELMGYFALNESAVIRQILNKEYKPQPVRRVYIPKPNSDKLRPLGIPTVTDRVVQQMVARVFTQEYDPLFSPHSYGFRPNRDCHKAMAEALEYLNEGIIAATNEYRVGDVVLDTSRLSSNSQDRVTIWHRNNTWRATCFARNKRQYLYDATKMTYKYRNTGTPLPIVEIVFTNPNGNLIFGSEPYKRQQLDCKYVFDLSGSSSTLTVDVGTWNFVGMGESVGATGEWETIYSSQEPNTTTQTIVHTETYTYYDWIWDDDVGDWVEDREHPYTESYEWTEDYTVDMNWVLQPYKCYEFTFKQCGDKAMKVDMHEIYKTNPYRN